MSLAIETYLDRVMLYANRRGTEAAAIRDELRDHLLEKIERVCARGIPIEDAVFTAIEENGQPRVVGYSLRPAFPLLDIRIRGTARGVIAVGPRAVGVLALGWIAVGVFSIGLLSVGVVGLGAICVAALFGWAGIAVVPTGLAVAGMAVGLVAVGVVACGVIAGGWTALGLWAGGIHASSLFTYDTAPGWLRWIGPYIPSMDEMVLLSTVMLAVLLPAMLLAHVSMSREQRRLRRVDPTLTE